MKTLSFEEYYKTQQESYIDNENVADMEVVAETYTMIVTAAKSLKVDSDYYYFAGEDEDFAVLTSEETNKSCLVYNCTLAGLISIIRAWEDVKRQIGNGWWIPVCDSGSGAAGVNYIKEEDIENIEDFLHTSEVCYIPTSEFDDEDKEILDKIFSARQTKEECNISEKEVLGFIYCNTEVDGMSYSYYILHVAG